MLTDRQYRNCAVEYRYMTVLCEQGKITDAAPETAGIYYWKNLVNGKGYVGKTLNLQSRMNDYVKMRFKTQRAFYAAVKKYGLQNFTCYKVMDCCPSDVALNYWETYWIRELDTFADGGNGYNLTTGGEGGKRSEESRKKLSVAHRGKKFSVEHRKNISDALRGEKNPFYGKKHSAETLKKMSCAQRGEKSANYGKKLSDEHRKKIGDAQRGEKNTNYGKKLSAETLKKMSCAASNMSVEHRKKISDALRGKKHSDDTRKKMSYAQRGKKLSDEHRKKLIDAWVRRRKSKLVNTETLYNEVA